MCEKIWAINAALKFIEVRLREPITVADIAASAGYSLYHFIRNFNQTVQHTPYDYLMRRRLSEAALELLNSKHRVIDIALDFQFNNHETFTRAFGRIFGMPPTQWRERGFRDARVLMPALDQSYLEYLNASEFEAPNVVTLDEIILAGLMAPLNADPEMIPTLWQNLRTTIRRSALNQELPDFWGIRTRDQISVETSYYFAAIKIPSLEAAPTTCVTKILSAGDYVRLTQRNPTENLQLALKYLYHTYLPKSGLSLADPLEIEHFGDLQEILFSVNNLPNRK